jgi:glycosyltransferase involved in cell wall biosynthesis
MNILWLASWYPTRINFLTGDFIERHAKAASLYDSIVVIHVVKDTSIKTGKTQIEKIEYSQNLTAFVCYYPAYKKLGWFFENIFSAFYYIKLHFEAYSIYKGLFGKPEGILVQVAIKAGIIAYLWRLTFRIQYIVFERWTGLLKEARPNFFDLNFFYRWLWKLIFKSAIKIVTVTKDFGNAIAPLMPKKQYAVIPNVIMDELFYPAKQKNNTVFRLVHVSTLDYQKNFEDILLALQLLVKEPVKIEMLVYGPLIENLKLLSFKLGLENTVDYRGEVTHAEIAKAMQASHALILYSRYESFGNVIIEANACGLPVIVSDLPVFREIVIEGVTGAFVEGQAPEKLADRIRWLVKNYDQFDPKVIHDHVKQQYNAAVIGNKFHQLFQSCFQK